MSSSERRQKIWCIFNSNVRLNSKLYPTFQIPTFQRFKYPLAELISFREKGKENHSPTKKSDSQPRAKKQTPLVIAPHSTFSEPVRALLSPFLSIVTTGGRKVGKMLLNKKDDKRDEDKCNSSVVYRIPCGKCSRVYYGETGRGLKTRMREHKGDLRNHRVSNAFVTHVDEAEHLPDWARATSLRKDFTKIQRKIVEAAFIATEDTLNISQGFF